MRTYKPSLLKMKPAESGDWVEREEAEGEIDRLILDNRDYAERAENYRQRMIIESDRSRDLLDELRHVKLDLCILKSVVWFPVIINVVLMGYLLHSLPGA
jgi:hypothetical protein